MSSGRKATEMIRVSTAVHAALRMYRTDESIRRGKRVTDSQAIKSLFEQCRPEYLKRALDMLGTNAETDTPHPDIEE